MDVGDKISIKVTQGMSKSIMKSHLTQKQIRSVKLLIPD